MENSVKDGMVIENVHYSVLHVPVHISILIITRTKYGFYMKMICCHLSLHCPGDIMTQFVKYFILYLRNELPSSKYPVLFQFVAMPTFLKWRFSLHNTRRWELEKNCKCKNVESTVVLKISPLFDRPKEQRIHESSEIKVKTYFMFFTS